MYQYLPKYEIYFVIHRPKNGGGGYHIITQTLTHVLCTHCFEVLITEEAILYSGKYGRSAN